MNPENTKKLIENYPNIFELVTSPGEPPHHCISLFMFECDDGWYDIIDTLCMAIQHHIDHRKRDIEWDINFNQKMEEAKNNNWENWPQYHAKEPRAVREPIPQVVAVQIKEKFGGLRFYYDGGDDFIHAIVQMAELMSERTCEVCGDKGKLYQKGWHRTLCKMHAEEQGYDV